MEKNYMIDEDGKAYIVNESYPCGNGLDKRCSHNADALKCYYEIKNRKDIEKYLMENGYGNPIHNDEHISIWEKGDTKIYFEDCINNIWGYLTTEYVGR